MNEPEVEVDMEELEACLYGQIHHFATVNENLSITNEVHATSIRSCARYFEQHKPHYVSPISDGVGSDPLTKINPPANSIVVVPPPVPQVFRQPNKSSRMWLETLLTDVDKIARRREKRRRNRQKKRNRIMPFRGIGTEYFVKLPYVSSTAVKEQVILKQDVKPKEEMYEALSDTSDVVTMDTSPEVISICDDNEDLESVSEDEFNINSPEPIVDESKKPACEGASSTSSTIDYTENFQDHNREELLKELNPHSNNMFSELNLDTFADYMEGGEKTSNINILSKSPFENKQKRRISEAAINSSDSSSESEYDVEQSNESDNDNVVKDLSDTAVVPRRTSENVDTVTDKSEDLLAKRIKLDDDQNERAISDESVLLIDTSSIGYISNDDVIVIDDNESVSSVEFVMSIKPPSLQTRQRLNAEDKHFSSQKQKDQKLSTSPKGKDGKCSLPVREKNGKSLYLIGKVRNLPPAQKRKKGKSFSPKGDHGKSSFPPKETSRKSLPPNSREGKSFSPKGNCGKAFSAKGNDGKSSIPPKDKGGKSSFSAGEKYGKNFPVKDNVEKSLSPRKRDGKSFAPKGNCEKSSFSAKEKDGKSSNPLKKKDGASSFLTKGKDGKSVPPKEKEGRSSFPSIEKSQISFPLENKDEKSLPLKEKNTKPFSPKGSYEKSSFSANEKNGKSSIPPKEKIGECSFPAKELGEKSSFLPMGDGKNSFQSKEIDGKCSLPTNEREGKSCISKRKDDKLPIAQKTNRTSSLPPNENQLKSETFMKYWSDDMEKFYKGSWGQENFSVIEQQRKMSDNPSMWKIISSDRVNINLFEKRPRCRRCREFGHHSIKCTKKLEPPKCILCGTSGHTESRCPHKMCTSCGRHSSYYTTYCSSCVSTQHVMCTICKMHGHTYSYCPDLWRRYFFTTEEGELVQPRGADLKNAEQQWCSGCGSNGHLEQNCCYYNRTHAPRSVFIYNYEDVYKDSTDNENEKQSVVPNTSSIDTTTKESANDDCYIFLTQTEHQRLCATEGKKFLQLMQTELNVTVEVNSLSSDKFKYIVIGDPTKVNEGKCAITRFCVVQDLLKYSGSYYAFKATPCTLKSLEENFKYLSLSVAHWRSSAKKLYYQIQGCKYFKDLDVRKRYIRLNSVVNSFLQEPNAIQHMDVLKCCVRERKPVVEESFNYIFNNDKELFPNYRKVISTLPAKNYMIDLKPIKVEKLKQIVTCICKRLGRGKALKKIKEKYLQLIIKNYPDRLVELFNKEVQQLITAEKGSRKKCN